jgi:hypothetical protein
MNFYVAMMTIEEFKSMKDGLHSDKEDMNCITGQVVFHPYRNIEFRSFDSFDIVVDHQSALAHLYFGGLKLNDLSFTASVDFSDDVERFFVFVYPPSVDGSLIIVPPKSVLLREHELSKDLFYSSDNHIWNPAWMSNQNVEVLHDNYASPRETRGYLVSSNPIPSGGIFYAEVEPFFPSTGGAHWIGITSSSVQKEEDLFKSNFYGIDAFSSIQRGYMNKDSNEGEGHNFFSLDRIGLRINTMEGTLCFFNNGCRMTCIPIIYFEPGMRTYRVVCSLSDMSSGFYIYNARDPQRFDHYDYDVTILPPVRVVDHEEVRRRNEDQQNDRQETEEDDEVVDIVSRPEADNQPEAVADEGVDADEAPEENLFQYIRSMGFWDEDAINRAIERHSGIQNRDLLVQSIVDTLLA